MLTSWWSYGQQHQYQHGPEVLLKPPPALNLISAELQQLV